MKYYKIGELSTLTNNTIVTLRHYEKLGLLSKIKRSTGGFRLYPERVISQLHFITNTKCVGFDLTDIKQLFSLQEKPSPSLNLKKKTQGKISEVENKIKKLEKIKTVLEGWEKACDGKVPIKKCTILNNLYQPVERD